VMGMGEMKRKDIIDESGFTINSDLLCAVVASHAETTKDLVPDLCIPHPRRTKIAVCG